MTRCAKQKGIVGFEKGMDENAAFFQRILMPRLPFGPRFGTRPIDGSAWMGGGLSYLYRNLHSPNLGKENKKVDTSFQTHPLFHLGVTLPFDKNYLVKVARRLVLLAALSVTGHELINTACRIYKLGLASVEGVRRA